jgi:CTP synthase
MKKITKTKFIVVVGGVISGVGKGIVTASLGKIMQEHGYNTTLIKIDPYLNYDAGTLRPTEHGEVWVTEDGGEIDQDLGTYERFLNRNIPRENNITTGQIYQTVITRERKGEYLGQTVQIIPHITNEIIHRIKHAADDYDIAIIEVGGTVGDYENVPFLYALKTLERELGSHMMVHVLVTYLPVPSHIGEMKTKPTQQAIRLLGQESIIPDFIICRAQDALDDTRKQKIEACTHIPLDHIIAAPNIDTIYQQPLNFEQQSLGQKILDHLELPIKQVPDWNAWRTSVDRICTPKNRISIAIVGKYLDIGSYNLTDSYISIYHALIHAGAQLDTAVDITWIDAKTYEQEPYKITQLNAYDGLIVPGGFGSSGVEGKIQAIAYARTHNIPYLGLCYGLHLAVVEFARSVVGLSNAHTTEVDPKTAHPVIDLLPFQKQHLQEQSYGGTMRLGQYEAYVQEGTRVFDIYNHARRIIKTHHGYVVKERHRHRYEVNPAYVAQLASKGLVFSGYYKRSDETILMEYIELPDHPFFIATQAHPEFTSRLTNPNPLFSEFVVACLQHKSLQVQPYVSALINPTPSYGDATQTVHMD